VSVSTRRHRVTVYPLSTTVDAGRVTTAYGAARGTYFARISPIVGRETTNASQADHREECVFEFADYVTVERDDMLTDPDGVQWKVAAVTLRRVLRQKLVRAFRSDDQPDADAA
jgi:hypothetical protein